MGCSLHEGWSMANPEHLDILKQGVEVWNRWRVANPHIKPDLHDADLAGANLSRAGLIGADLAGSSLTGAHLAGAFLLRATLYGATFARADLTKAFLYGAFLFNATLVGATLTKATLTEANLTGATLAGANLTKAILTKATLAQADLRQADFRGANLALAIMVDSNFEGANLTGCWVYGIAAWNLKLVGAHQSDLVITQPNEPVITVDDMEVAQFIYLLLNNEKIRHVIDTITTKVVLILGRFTPERKAVLDAMREELRTRGWLPVLFDFDKPGHRDLTETISTLAHMARFIISD